MLSLRFGVLYFSLFLLPATVDSPSRLSIFLLQHHGRKVNTICQSVAFLQLSSIKKKKKNVSEAPDFERLKPVMFSAFLQHVLW